MVATNLIGNPFYYHALPNQSIDNNCKANRLNSCYTLNPFLSVPYWRQSSQGPLTISEKAANLRDDEIRIFPNPTNDRLTILLSDEFNVCEIRITDLTGKVVYNTKINSSANTIDVSELASSIYFIELKTPDNKIVRKKLIKTD